MPDLGKLAQLSGGNAAKMKELVEATQTLYKTGGAASTGQAAATVFELGSAEAPGEVGLMARLATIAGPGGTAPLAQKAGVIQAGMGAGETGDYTAIFSKAVAAAAPVSGASMTDLLQAVSEAAPMAKPLGLSDEEVFAAASLISQKMGPAKAGTALQSMLRAFGRKGFAEKYAGEGLERILGVVEEKQMTTPEAIKFFGEAEAQKGFASLDPAGLQARLREIREAERTGAIESMIATAEGVPMIAAERARRMAEALSETSRESSGLRAQRAAAIDAQRTAEFSQHYGPLGDWVDWATRGWKWADPRRIGATLGIGGDKTSIDAAAADLKEAASSLRTETRRRPVTVVE